MQSKRLGLGIVITLAASMLVACDTTSTNPVAVAAPGEASFARGGSGGSGGGGKPHVSSTSAQIAMTPSTLQLAVGAGGWIHVTLYDKNGTALPDNDGSLLWYGCKPADPAMDTCIGYLNVAPVYPNLRDAYLSATGAGTFTVWVDDGNGHRASAVVTVQ